MTFRRRIGPAMLMGFVAGCASGDDADPGAGTAPSQAPPTSQATGLLVSACDGTFVSSDVPKRIPDNNTAGASSTLSVSGAGTISSATITLHITHTFRGDLSGTLRTPSGTIITAFARPAATDSNDNIVLSAVPLSGVAGLPSLGTWTLNVVDHASTDVGTIDSWSLSFVCEAAPPPTCLDGTFVSSDVPKAIPDNNAAGASSTLSVSGTGTISSATITLHITHTFRGDLSGTLRTPSGAIVTAFARPAASDSNDNIVLSAVPLSGVAGLLAMGTWTLNVVDHASQEVGTIDSWSLSFVCGAPPPPGNCVHSECNTGVRLTSGCNPCVTRICARDPFCCANNWDNICVGEARSICGESCP